MSTLSFVLNGPKKKANANPSQSHLYLFLTYSQDQSLQCRASWYKKLLVIFLILVPWFQFDSLMLGLACAVELVRWWFEACGLYSCVSSLLFSSNWIFLDGARSTWPLVQKIRTNLRDFRLFSHSSHTTNDRACTTVPTRYIINNVPPHFYHHLRIATTLLY